MNGYVLGRKAMVLYFDEKEFTGREENFCSIASVLSDDYNKAFDVSIKITQEYESIIFL